MKNIRAYVLLESLLLCMLAMSLLSGLLYLFHFQERLSQQFSHKASQYRQLMGFDALFTRWMKSFSVLACLYPLEKFDDEWKLHGVSIWKQSTRRLEFFTGRLTLMKEYKPIPKNIFAINQEHLKVGNIFSTHPFWLFIYEKQVLKWTADKIYLEHDGHTQMLLDGLKGFNIEMHHGEVRLHIQEPHFEKRYQICSI